MLNIHREFNELMVDVDLEDCIYINQGFSASGKTFLMQLLLDYANVNNKSVCLYDYHNISNIDGVLISPLGIFYPINDGNHSLAVGVLENKGTWDFKETSVLISTMSQKNISTNKYNIPSKYIHPKLFLLNELGIILSNANIDIAYI